MLSANNFEQDRNLTSTINTNERVVESLPLLEALLQYYRSKNGQNLDEIIFVCVQHLLDTTPALFTSLIKLGANPKNIFLLGKSYSACPHVVDWIKLQNINLIELSDQVQFGGFATAFRRDVNRLWHRVEDKLTNNHQKILILDDGGNALASTPPNICFHHTVIGVEQTSAGLFNNEVLGMPFSIVEMATSAAKKQLESPIIASEVMNTIDSVLSEQLSAKETIFGIIGYGSIGKAVCKKLCELGKRVIVYDKQYENDTITENLIFSRDISTLVASADCIVGCSGKDTTQLIAPFLQTFKNKVLVSCSSEDKEFLTLLHFIQLKHKKRLARPDFLSDVEYHNEAGAKIKIIKGGFPINFNQKIEISSPQKIQLTRGLLLGSVLQAANFLYDNKVINAKENFMVSPYLQTFIAQQWLTTNEDACVDEVIKNFTDINWIIEASSGELSHCDFWED